jgi:hypothetical protein
MVQIPTYKRECLVSDDETQTDDNAEFIDDDLKLVPVNKQCSYVMSAVDNNAQVSDIQVKVTGTYIHLVIIIQ